MGLVYDGSNKTKEKYCLNDILYCGPVVLRDFVGILIRIPTHGILIFSEIEKTFHMACLHPKIRDCTHLYWPKNLT
ncbi:unnamed protein product [Angiostrongylus costaricensis]|uniref:Uncharacterized protein n=1 Tax=Angiostrongylus costaricensis TaxID=334426 RepID=A0A0R3Q1M5_ANGCS|nr:unnamed protein product [Angiostrongylus costaricensis]